MKQITVYSKDYCPYCKAAKQLLDAKGLNYIEIDVLKQPEKLSEMLKRSQRRTVPQIFFDDEHIGGYTDLVAYYRNRRVVRTNLDESLKIKKGRDTQALQLF